MSINSHNHKHFTDILSWCDYSGEKLSVQKCKHLHICRKTKSYSLNQASSLKILGVTISSKYRWKEHIDTLTVELSKRLNIIKWLGNRRYKCDTRSLINTINALVMSKTDYCVPFYGNCPLSCLRKLKTIYHAALKLAFGAPRTTPINNLLIEAEITPIEIRLSWPLREFLRFSHSLKICRFKLSFKVKNSKRKPRILSILHKASKFALENWIISTSVKLRKQKHPPWTFLEDKIDLHN